MLVFYAFPQKSEGTNTVLIINGLANWIAALFTCMIRWYSQLFRGFFFSIRMRSGWCLPWIFFGRNLMRNIHQFSVHIAETQQAVPLMRKSLSGPPACAPSREICFSACSWGITETQGAWESPASSSDPVQYKNKVRSGGNKRFFELQLVKLCFMTSTGRYFWQKMNMFKSREAPSAPQTQIFCVLQGIDVTWSILSCLKGLDGTISELHGTGALSPSLAFMVKQKILRNHQQLQI